MTHPAPAPLGRRFLAYVVDQVAIAVCGGGLLVGAMVPVDAATSVPRLPAALLLLGWGLLGALTIFQWWAQGTRGWTIGKRLLGLRTVDARSGRPVGMGRIFVRGFVVGVGVLVLGVGQLVVLASPLWDRSGRHRGWHDRSAGDEVVDLRTGTLPAPRPKPRPASTPTTPRRASTSDADPTTVTVVPTWLTDRDHDEGSASATAADAAHDAAARQLNGLLSDRHTGGTGLVLPPLPGPGVAPDVDTRALSVLLPRAFGLDPELEQTRHSPLRPDERSPEWAVDPSTADLELSDGRIVTIAGGLLVGRNPSADDGSQLLRVADPGRSVSKTHLQVGIDAAGVWVADRGSTNGTLVTLAGGSQIVCGPGQKVRLPMGATVSFGDCGLRIVRAPQAASPA
jgi:uncharacterized RDD family membrane protein YckC